MLFLVALIALVLYQLRRDIHIVDRLKPASMLHSPVKRAGMVFILLLIVPFAFVQASELGGSLPMTATVAWTLCIFISFLISYTWYRYLTWLDPFEREKLGWEIGLFLVASACTFLTFPLSDLVIPALGLTLDGDHWNDWWYSVIGIGLVEESVKLIPLLLLLAFTKQVDEPFDLILYGSIAALGFAFVENTLYLMRTDLHAVGGRVLFASVAHMFFTSIIAYSIAMARHQGRSPWLYGALGLVIASVAHGFYDYWLLSPGRPYLLTLLFFLANIHLWVAMKNNLVNLSPHYQVDMRPQPTMFRYRIINALLAIFGFTYVMKFLLEGIGPADHLLEAQGTTMGAMLLFLAISFSSFRFVPGYIAPLHPKGGLWRFLMPAIAWGEDLAGQRLLMRIPEKRPDARHYMDLHRMLPLEGRFTQRVIMDDDKDWYLFLPERPISFDGVHGEALLVRPHRANDTIPNDHYVVVVVMAFKQRPLLLDGRAYKQQLEFVGFVHGRLL
jgi:RsiW-degrading membrane proteinase PrsW (M82 family)